MKNIAVACNTLRDELRLVIKELEVKCPVLWVDSGLHNVPANLNKAIQDLINRIENVDNIILLFGNCGNSLAGLTSPNARIIFPRVDDCISMFLGGNEKRRKLEKEAPSYFFTKGYLKNEANIWSEYLYTIDKYGEQRAKSIYDQMLKHYKNLLVIDTGAFDPDEIYEETSKIAKEFGLEHKVTEGSLSILQKAFKEQWDEDFVQIEPGEKIGYSHLGIG